MKEVVQSIAMFLGYGIMAIGGVMLFGALAWWAMEVYWKWLTAGRSVAQLRKDLLELRKNREEQQ